MNRVSEAGSLGCSSSCKSLFGRITCCCYMDCYMDSETRCKWKAWLFDEYPPFEGFRSVCLVLLSLVLIIFFRPFLTFTLSYCSLANLLCFDLLLNSYLKLNLH